MQASWNETHECDGSAHMVSPGSDEVAGPRSATRDQVNFYFDPVCPFAWLTSKWVRRVADLRGFTVDWRFISLWMVNSAVDYDARFPAGYATGHVTGLKLLRVAAAARTQHGNDAVARLYEAYGTNIFDRPAGAAGDDLRGTPAFVEPVLADAGLPRSLAAALDDDSYDEQIRADTDEALGLTGRDVGTPIIHFDPPTGVAFFGPVISRVPSDEDALRLWDHVVGLARFPGFSELKRSLRERPQFVTAGDQVGPEEDWHRGSRRPHR